MRFDDVFRETRHLMRSAKRSEVWRFPVSTVALLAVSSVSTIVPIYTPATILLLIIVQELCESRGGRPGLSVLTSLLVSVDVKLY